MKILVVVDFDGCLVVVVRTTRSLRGGCISKYFSYFLIDLIGVNN